MTSKFAKLFYCDHPYTAYLDWLAGLGSKVTIDVYAGRGSYRGA